MYNSPGVYIEDVSSGSQTVQQASASIGAMVGALKMGRTDKSQLVTSWADFLTKYSSGVSTPFWDDSYLPYAVYGFFANGGQQLYIQRVVSNTSVVAKAKGSILSVTASNAGTWANGLTVSLVKNEDFSDSTDTPNLEFNVIVTLDSVGSVTIQSVYKETLIDSILSNSYLSKWIESVEIVAENGELAEETITLAGGTDETSSLTYLDYESGLTKLSEYIDEITMVSIPGVTTTSTVNALLSFCETNKVFPIITTPVGTTVEDCKAFRKSISSTYGALVYPWGVMTDPLTGRDKLVPPEGHYMGVCARVINNRGEFKAPAGTEAKVSGFNYMELSISKNDLDVLNPSGVICMITKRNYGIIVWGARGLNSSDSTMKYVSDHFLNIVIRKDLYASTQFAVFEPNDENLWARIETICKNYLQTKAQAGALKGSGEGSSYYVLVDSSNNPEESISEGNLIIEIGYAPVKPAEFIVIKLAHSINSAE